MTRTFLAGAILTLSSHNVQKYCARERMTSNGTSAAPLAPGRAPPRSSDAKPQPLLQQLLQVARVSPALQDGLQVAMQGRIGGPHSPRKVLLGEGGEG